MEKKDEAVEKVMNTQININISDSNIACIYFKFVNFLSIID